MDGLNLLYQTPTLVNKDDPSYTRKTVSRTRAQRMCDMDELTVMGLLKGVLRWVDIYFKSCFWLLLACFGKMLECRYPLTLRL